jgi:hypothetical protein
MGETIMERSIGCVMKSLIPPTAELVVMPKPHDQPAVTVADLDGDSSGNSLCLSQQGRNVRHGRQAGRGSPGI